jgi:hypothetical protein
MTKRRAAWAGVAAIGLLLCLAVGWLVYLVLDSPRAGYDRIVVGMGEQDVTTLMGRQAGHSWIKKEEDRDKAISGKKWQKRGTTVEVAFDRQGKVVWKRIDPPDSDALHHRIAKWVRDALGL